MAKLGTVRRYVVRIDMETREQALARLDRHEETIGQHRRKAIDAGDEHESFAAMSEIIDLDRQRVAGPPRERTLVIFNHHKLPLSPRKIRLLATSAALGTLLLQELHGKVGTGALLENIHSILLCSS